MTAGRFSLPTASKEYAVDSIGKSGSLRHRSEEILQREEETDMADNRISAAALGALSCLIADLDDVPSLDAQALKEYFDTSPQELMAAHNALVAALTATSAAGALGFAANDTIPASNVQQALEYLQGEIDAMHTNTSNS